MKNKNKLYITIGIGCILLYITNKIAMKKGRDLSNIDEEKEEFFNNLVDIGIKEHSKGR